MPVINACQSDIIDSLVLEFGSMAEVSNVLQVNRTTVWRWRHNEVILEGVANVAVMAVLRHPGDYKTKEA